MDLEMGLMGHDLRYLLTRVPTECEWSDDARWVGFVIRNFGQVVVTEALRRVHGTCTTRPYFYGVCRNVAAE